MKYFTLEEDLREIRASRLKSIKLIFIIPAILILLTLLRGFGAVTLELKDSSFKATHFIRKEVFEESRDGETGRRKTITQTLKTDENDSGWNWGVTSDLSELRKGNKEVLEKAITTRLARENALKQRFEFAVVSVEKFEKSGLYWFPLIKSGRGTYRVIVRNQVYNDNYFADFEGNFDFEIYGFCTPVRLEENNAERIAKTIVDSIKNDYKK